MTNKYYEVKSGDTLWAICKKQFNLTSNSDIANKVAEVAKNNSIFDGQIDVGQKIDLGFDAEIFEDNSETQIQAKDAKKIELIQSEVLPEQKIASVSTETERISFVDFAKKTWSSFFWSQPPKEDVNVRQMEYVRVPVSENEPEVVIPSGHIEAPNGKITKVYTSQEIEQIIVDSCNKYKVDSTLVKAIISVESSNNQFAESKAGAQGLMQLMPNGAGKGLENAYDAKTNIERGVQEFARLRRFYGNNTDALRAYNYGERRYNEFLSGKRTHLPAETKDYPQKVLSCYEKYSKSV